MSKLGMCAETIPLRRSVEMAVEILEAMDESVVARKSVDIIKHYLREFRASDVQSASMGGASMEGNTATFASETVPSQGGFDIPVGFSASLFFLFENTGTDLDRNGLTDSAFLIVRSKGLLGFSMTWVGCPCWTIN